MKTIKAAALLILLGLLCSATSCQSTPSWNGPRLDMSQEPGHVENQIKQIVTVKQPIADVKSILEHNGFKCVAGRDAVGPYLDCTRRDSTQWLGLAGETWRVTVRYEQDVVTNLQVKHGQAGS